VTNYQMTFESFGSNGVAKMNSAYTLNYIYLHSEVGGGINAFAPFAGIITNVQTILVAIFSNDRITGAVDISLQGLGQIGVVSDPAGNQFWGVQFALRVLEYNQ